MEEKDPRPEQVLPDHHPDVEEPQKQQEQKAKVANSVSRRGFLARVGGVAAASVAVDTLGFVRLGEGPTVAEQQSAQINLKSDASAPINSS